MQPLITSVPQPEFPFRINHQHQLLSMGSCFAEHIGKFLARRKFEQVLNPFGIVYHPVVLANLLEQLLEGEAPNAAALFEQQELWRHYDFHSRFAHPKQEETLALLRSQFELGAARVRRLDFLILTLGTAYGYQLQSEAAYVNNCHKQPAALFEKNLASVEEMVVALQRVLGKLKAVNPQLEVILTISPVRHLRDGLLENQRSKARLLLAQEQVCASLPFVHYFPAYEIVLDELRDYRFYTRDLLHPNELAVDIVTSRFASACFAEPTQELARKVEQLVRASEHRQQHSGSKAAQQFVRHTLQKIEVLTLQHPYLDFSEEIKRLSASINPGFPGA